MNFINTPIINKEIKNENIPIYKGINTINSEVQIVLKVVGSENIPNNERLEQGNLTLNEFEKKVNVGAYVFDRGMSIRNLNKTLLQLQNEQNSPLIFYLMKKSEKLIKDLEECEINFINVGGQSCYQSATLQGFVHIIFPMAIKYINNKRQIKGYEKVENLDELKNDSLFNNTVIETIKGLLNIQKCGSGGVDKNGIKRFKASELFEIAPPLLLGGEDINNVSDINSLNNKNIDESISPEEAVQKAFSQIISNPPKKNLLYNMFTGKDLVKVIEIGKKTIVSEIMKFKIEGNDKYFGNIVLKFTEDL